jgi:hypothetical protein
LPYNASNATIYTGLDYRPATGSILLSGADFTDIATLGTPTFENNVASLVIAPNPFNSNFKIYFTSVNSDDVNVSVYDITGRLIESSNVKFLEINNSEFGNNYNAGVYIVVLKQAGVSKSFRVIKK